MKRTLSILLLFISIVVSAETYTAQVIDNHRIPVSYATVYILEDPAQGTATNSDGFFTLITDAPQNSTLIVSFLGYEKTSLALGELTENQVIVLQEQPIQLEEMVVSAAPSKQKNKRKQMAHLLYQVYQQLDADWPDIPIEYQIVSDMKMLSEGQPWGMEQMIAKTVSLPEKGEDKRDSIQFVGTQCKRYFKPEIRQRADLVYQGKLDKDVRNMALQVDSGVLTHETLWASRQAKYHFLEQMQDWRHWTVSRENEGETVLTYTEKHNYLGIVKYEVKSHYIIQSSTYHLLRFSEDFSIEVNIPFGHKLKGQELAMLNLLNMNNDDIEKFRLKRMSSHVQMNTIYQFKDGYLLPKERNVKMDALLSSNKQGDIHVVVNGTQYVTQIRTKGVKAFPAHQLHKRVQREIVPIY